MKILSDNAKTFKGAEGWIVEVVRHKEVQDHLLEHNMTRQFNVERAPWWGGVFERMVLSMKRLLR